MHNALTEIETLFARYQKTGPGTRAAFNSNVAEMARDEEWKTLADYAAIARRFVETCERDLAADLAYTGGFDGDLAPGTCTRCLGSGKFGPLQVEGGVCFECDGSGRV
jgi:hypothetical protein